MKKYKLWSLAVEICDKQKLTVKEIEDKLGYEIEIIK